MSAPNLPQIAEAHEGGRAAERAVQDQLAGRFVVRLESQPDYGSDATIEVIHRVAGRAVATNHRAHVQIKHTSAEPHPDGSLDCIIHTKNLNYLGAGGLALYILLIPSTGRLLFRWWHDVIHELSRDRPDWNSHKEIAIRFRREVDANALEEIATELDAYAALLQRMRDGPSFIRAASQERVREMLLPEPLFVGRAAELSALGQQSQPGSLVPIIGLPDAGKTELLAQYLGDRGLAIAGHAWDQRTAFLVLDLEPRVGPHRALRSLSYALGIPKITAIDELDDESEDTEALRARLVSQLLPARLQGAQLVALIENVDVCSNDAQEAADVDALLTSQPFRSGVILVTSRSGAVPQVAGRRKIQDGIRLGPLRVAEAAQLLGELGADRLLAQNALERVAEVEDLLLPGVIRHAVAQMRTYELSSRESPTALQLADSLRQAAEDTVVRALSGLGLREVVLGAPPAAFDSLLALAVAGTLRVRADMLESAGLPMVPFSTLAGMGLAESSRGRYRLSPLLRQVTRTYVIRRLQNERSAEARSLIDAVGHLTVALSTVDSDDESLVEYADALEESLAWLRRAVPTAHILQRGLLTALLPFVADDLFLPASTDELTEIQTAAAEGLDPLRTTLAQVTLRARLPNEAAAFLSDLRSAVDATVAAPMLHIDILRALDIAAYAGERRHRRYRDIYDIRRLLSGRLQDVAAAPDVVVGIVKWACSWSLNTTRLAVGLGNTDDASTLLGQTRALLDRLPTPIGPRAVIDCWAFARASHIWKQDSLQESYAAIICARRSA